jgi:hypothetical protein
VFHKLSPSPRAKPADQPEPASASKERVEPEAVEGQLRQMEEQTVHRSIMYLHRFTISVEELQLSQEESGECLVTYRFPH